MITTGCEGCCFLEQDDKGKKCVLGQMCSLKNEKAFAPGYCRLCRSHKWMTKQDETNVKILYEKILEENSLKFDLLVVFDEAINNIIDLEETLNSDWYIGYAKKIIIMDITGFGNRKNYALQYLKSRKHLIHTVVDSSVVYEPTDQRETTIRRVSKQVTSPFFMIIPAGYKLNNLSSVAKMIKNIPSRVIHWSFPFSIGCTAIISNKMYDGLFLTIPYRALIKSAEVKSFAEQLRKEEIETEMGFSWFCVNCWMGQ